MLFKGLSQVSMSRTSLTSIDLFAGCGGFTLGLNQAGIRTLAAVDNDPHAIKVLAANLPDVATFVEDITQLSCNALADAIGVDTIDLVVGGPPCQGFSHVRQRDGANSGPRLVHDERRDLFQQFLRFVEFFTPRVFVMENVPGIKSADSGRYYRAVHREARTIGYRVSSHVVHAVDHGLPQKRKRQLIIGVRADIGRFFRSSDLMSRCLDSQVTLWEAIGDLPPLAAGSGTDPCDRDLERLKKQLERYGSSFLSDVSEVHKEELITAHVARPHNERDLRDFNRLREGETAGQAIAREQEMEFPYDRSSFKDRFTRQHRNRLCSTIVAHLSKDGLMFIHPTQCRSLTPREAARVQGFPDWYKFTVPRTHQFRMIGNAVPPPIAHDIGVSIERFLNSQHSRRIQNPASQIEAANRIESLFEQLSDGVEISDISLREMNRIWRSILFLYPGLHPDDDDHGSQIIESEVPIEHPVFAKLSSYHELSGWPVELVPFLDEMRLRYMSDRIPEDDFYCAEASLAGLRVRTSVSHD